MSDIPETLPSTPVGKLYGKRYRRALDDAARWHRCQTRKGTDVPYVAHVLTVSSLVWSHGGDEDTAIAALLHDVVEDQGGLEALELIRKRYGKKVARIVDDCSDTISPTDKPPWVDRKRAHIEHLAGAAPDTLLVVAADKTDNLESILADFIALGDELWGRFNAGGEAQVWYHREINLILASGLGVEHPLVARHRRALGQLAARLGISVEAAAPPATAAPPA
jgi:(p)ppGpp synthase/HD superfamily hydrolase